MKGQRWVHQEERSYGTPEGRLLGDCVTGQFMNVIIDRPPSIQGGDSAWSSARRHRYRSGKKEKGLIRVTRMAFNDSLDHNVRCGQEGHPETTMESHEMLFLLLAPAIVLVVPVLLFLTVVALLKREKTPERTVREVSKQFSSRQDSTHLEVSHRRTRRKRRKNAICTRAWRTDYSSAELHTVGPTVVGALLHAQHVHELRHP